MGKKALLLLVTLIFAVIICGAASAATTTQVSLTPSKTQPNGDSCSPQITPDGRYVAFDSDATNMVTPVKNGKSNVYVKDRQSNQLIWVSKTQGGKQPDNHCTAPAITPNARYVAYQSNANNLGLGITNGKWNIYVYDGWSGKTIRITRGLNNAQPNGNSYNPSITPDGRYVAFESTAKNLFNGVNNGKSNIFVYDGWTGKLTWITRSYNGAQPNGDSYNPSITPDGRYVAFESTAKNLSDIGHNVKDVFVYDGWAHDGWAPNPICVSIGIPTPPNLWTIHNEDPKITPDGRYVTFTSSGYNSVTGRTSNSVYVFDSVYYSSYSKTIDVSKGMYSGYSRHSAITPDGRYLAFEYHPSAGNISIIVVYDGWTGKYIQIRGLKSATPNGWCQLPVFTPNARFVAFMSTATNLVTPPSNGKLNVFLYDGW